MNYTRNEDIVVQQAAASANDDAVVQLSEIQLLVVGGGVADVTLS